MKISLLKFSAPVHTMRSSRLPPLIKIVRKSGKKNVCYLSGINKGKFIFCQVYGTSLEADVKGDTSGPFQRLLVMALEVSHCSTKKIIIMKYLF